MALTLVSILALATTAVVAAPLPQNEGVTPCKFTYYSQPGDTCRSIGLSSGYYDTDILAANSFLDCSNIWPNTPVCIPDIPYPVTVTYPTPTGPTPIPLPTPVCQANIKSVAGDTCDSIAEPYHMSGGNILAANTFLNCDDIWEGTWICIPAPYSFSSVSIGPTTTSSSISGVPVPTCSITYIVNNQGETCDSIGAQFGVSGTEILSYNDFLNCQDIWVNTPVCIPYVVITDYFPPDGPTTNGPPTPTSSSSGPIPVPTCASTYTVNNQGETCDSIGAQFGVSGTEILSYNDFLNCQDIWLYTSICVPPVVVTEYFPPDGNTVNTPPADPTVSELPRCANTYVVQTTGETCDSIGAQFGVSGTQIKAFNDFVNCEDIWTYTQICVPYPVISDVFPTENATTA